MYHSGGRFWVERVLSETVRSEDMTVVLAARNIQKLVELSKEIDCELVGVTPPMLSK